MKKNNKHIEILLDSFNIFKDDLQGNEEKLSEIIDICLLHDKKLAVEMWEHLINNNKSFIEQGNGYYITSRLLYLIFVDAGEHISKEEMCDIVHDNETIRYAMFKYTTSQISTYDALALFIINNKLEEANNIFECLCCNKNKDKSIAQILESMMIGLPDANDRYDEPISKAAAELITHWISSITDKTERATVSVPFLRKVSSL